MSVKNQQRITRFLPYLPFVFTLSIMAGVTLANTASQQTTPQGTNEWWLVIIGGLVTFLLRYQSQRITEQDKAIKTTQSTTPDLTAFDTLVERVKMLEARNTGMATQIEMLVENNKNAIKERERVQREHDRIQQEYSLEQTTHEHTRQLLKDERDVNAELSRTIDRMEHRIADLEKRIEKAEGVNDLATRIVDTMKDLLKHKTDELPKVSPA